MFSSLNLRQTLEVSLLITMFFFVSTILDWLDGFKANSYLYILNTHNSVSLAPVFNTGQLRVVEAKFVCPMHVSDCLAPLCIGTQTWV